MGETHDGVLLVRKILPHQEPAQQGHECEGKEQRSDERRSYGPRHRRKDSPFVALQSENRNVRHDDDKHREERGPAHLGGGMQHKVTHPVPVR